MIKFNTRQLTTSKIDQYINLGVNVLLIGKHGVGKTTKIIEGFQRNNLKYAYFSASTLDPWVHLIGVPKAKQGEDGKDYLDFILPKELDDDLEAIMCDEYNRAPSVVKNALMELLQFKQINGRKFPKLKMVWAAINPPKEEDEDVGDYDAEEMDLAQLDRFQVILELPYKPDKKYFMDKYGKIKGKVLVDWWAKQSKEAQKILSPRRLDYIGDYHEKGGDVVDLLPASANSVELIKQLNVDENEIIFKQVFDQPNEAIIKKFFADDKNYMKFIDRFDNPKYYQYFYLIKPEFVNQKIKNDEEFRYYVIAKLLEKNTFYQKAVSEIEKNDDKLQLTKITEIINIQNNGDLSKLLSLDDVNSGNVSQLSPCAKGYVNASPMLPQDYKMQNSITDINPTGYPRLQTQDFRKYFGWLKNTCHVEDIYQLLHVVLSGYNRMQEGTLQSINDFVPIFNRSIMRAKTELSDKDVAKVHKFISTHCKDKLKLKEKTLEYLRGTATPDMPSHAVHPKLKTEIDKAIALVNFF